MQLIKVLVPKDILMEKVLLILKMGIIMQEILLMQKPMVKEFIYFPTDPFMKVIFLILSFKAMEVWYT
jgi:hypothetical protein